jgi:ribonuclease HI
VSEVYDAELHAVHEALRIVLELKHTLPPRIYIFIDSLSVIRALQHNTDNSEPGKNAIQAAENLTTQSATISVVWTPGHSNIAGNECPDVLAK